ncbi:MAG: hypothetical protein J1E02_09275 [Coprobacter sp.]|nr:hypothetical protein [Coprobacter sp.]
MIRNIAAHIFSLTLFPARTWARIAEEHEPEERFLNRYLYPVMGVTALSAFGRFGAGDFSLEKALKWVTIDFVQYFAGFFVSAYLVGELLQRLCADRKDSLTARRYTGYLLSLLMTVAVLLNLLPAGCSFLGCVSLYAVYVAWTGARQFLQVPASRRFLFTAATAVIIGTVPVIIRYVLAAIMPGIEI